MSSSFRINPYLQNPSGDGITITWFTDTPETSTLSVSGPGLNGSQNIASFVSSEPLLDYTDAELTEEIDGIDLFYLFGVF